MARPRLLLSSPTARRYVGLALAVAAVASLVILAASLDNLELGPGEPFLVPKWQTPDSTPTPFEFPPLLLQAIAAILVVMITLATLVVLRSPRERRRMIRTALQLLLIVAVWALVARLLPPAEEAPAEPTQVPGAPLQTALPQFGATGVPETAFAPEPPPVPSWLSYILSLGVVLIAGAIGYWLWRLTRKQPAPLAEIASRALGQLSAGRNWEDVVIQCYASMNTAVSRQRGLQRHQTATAREFAAHLVQIGMPADAVHRLTRLFEQARYGSSQSDAVQAREAAECLSTIVDAAERRR